MYLKLSLIIIFLLFPYFLKSNVINTKTTITSKIGINDYDIFLRMLRDKNDMSYINRFKELSKYSITYLRINGGGAYHPRDWSLYLNDKNEYFKRLDALIKTAREYNIKLIFTFFWRYDTIPRLMEEPISAYGNPQSKTINFIKKYTKEIISRYKTSQTILGWEFGNEYNLKLDIPLKYFKNTFVKGEYKKQENILRKKDLNFVMKSFAEIINEQDSQHFISTGHSIPRTFIYEDVTHRNVHELLKKILLSENKYANTISVHIYPWALKNRKFYQFFNNINEFIAFLMQVAKNANKKLFIGEFAFCKINDQFRKKEYYKDYLDAIKKNNVPLSAMWVYQRTIDQSCNISTYDLKVLSSYNQGLDYQRLFEVPNNSLHKKKPSNVIQSKPTTILYLLF